MNKIKLLFLGVILVFLRIIISLIVTKFNLEIGYFFDVFIFIYLCLCLLLANQKFSFKNIVFTNFFIAIISIIGYDFYILIYKYYPIKLEIFLANRSIVALNILIISFLSSIFYFLAQQFLLKRRK